MADIKLKLIAEDLNKSLENLAPQVEQELLEAVGNVSQAAYASMIAQIQSMQMNPKNRQDYLRGLKYQKLDDYNYVIYLEGEWANKLESGFSGYSIKDQLLKSKKIVQSGSRAGKPWVRTSSKGKKYAAVPFEHKPFSGEKLSSGDLADTIKKLTAFNRQGQQQKFTKIFKDLDGKPLQGKVASIGKVDNPLLSGITKYQKVNPSGSVSSIYLTYRMVHEDSSGWQHPGHKGYNLFKQAEEYINQELENIINILV